MHVYMHVYVHVHVWEENHFLFLLNIFHILKHKFCLGKILQSQLKCLKFT